MWSGWTRPRSWDNAVNVCTTIRSSTSKSNENQKPIKKTFSNRIVNTETVPDLHVFFYKFYGRRSHFSLMFLSNVSEVSWKSRNHGSTRVSNAQYDEKRIFHDWSRTMFHETDDNARLTDGARLHSMPSVRGYTHHAYSYKKSVRHWPLVSIWDRSEIFVHLSKIWSSGWPWRYISGS